MKWRRSDGRHESLNRAEVTAENAKILRLLASFGEPTTAGELAPIVALRADTVWSHLYAGWKAGRVERYRLAAGVSYWRAR